MGNPKRQFANVRLPQELHQPNSKTNTEAETARTGDLVLDNNLILLDSEILKPHKDPNL